jgi:hypothetical protein
MHLSWSHWYLSQFSKIYCNKMSLYNFPVTISEYFCKKLWRCAILRDYYMTFFISSLKDLFSQFVSSKIFLQYKSQCLEKVNVKYVIKRLWHEFFYIVLGINPQPISALQLCCRAWYGSLGLIPGPIWKMSCNNPSFLVIKLYSNMLKCVNLIEIRFYTYCHASSFVVLWDHCADTGGWIRGVFLE